MEKIKRFLNKTLVIAIVLLSIVVMGCVQKELNTELTDNLKLEASYEGKTFLGNGIGKVTLAQKVDGDTAHFRDTDGTYFTARFLMINTPESTGKIDPWGKAASDFTADKLLNAKEIVCESEKVDSPAVHDSTGKRYLAYIWYRNSTSEDFRLLNLELVEQCYSDFTDNEGAGKYGTTFNLASEKSAKTGRRVFGEKDPNYDYSYSVYEITIAHLKDNIEQYTSTQGIKLKIKARIVRINGDNIYLEDYEKTSSDVTGEYATAGVYMYVGYGTKFSEVPLGTVLSFQCLCSKSDVYGFQLTNPSNYEIIEASDGSKDSEHREFDGKTEIDFASLEGLVIKVNRVKVLGVGTPNPSTSAYTIAVATDSGQKFNIRIDGNTHPKYDRESVVVGEYYSIIGGVSRYDDSFQLMLCNQKKGFTKQDFVMLEK